MNSNKPTYRINYLDAARGIAACMVLFYHYTGWKYPEKLPVKLSHFIFNGSDAVSFFFVLSGLVLSFPFLYHSRPLDIGKFNINRIYRIYPAFLIALLLNVFYCCRQDLFHHPLETIFNLIIKNDGGFWEEAFLIKGKSRYLGLDWTLTVEIVISFLIPYLIVMTHYNKRILVWFTLSTFLVSNLLSIYIFPFALGMVICINFDFIQSEQFKTTVLYRYRLSILILAFLLFSMRHIDRLFPFPGKLKYWLSYLQLDFYTFSAFASFIFIIYIIHFKNVQCFLEHRFLLFLGKISYGIYLLHWLLVAYIFDHWSIIAAYFPSVKIAYITMMFICFVATIILASALHYWVELPFINKGKQLTQRMKSTIAFQKTNHIN